MPHMSSLNVTIVEGKKRPYKPRIQRSPVRIAKKGKRRATGKSKPFKKTDLKRADSVMSARIITRDKKCQYPGCNISDPTKLTCSHYFGRANKNVRFDEDNLIALCRTHHYWDKQLGWEFQKQTLEKHGWDGRYTLHMKARLGKLRWEALNVLAISKLNRNTYHSKIRELAALHATKEKV